LVVEPTAERPREFRKKVSYNNTQEITTGLLCNGSQQQPMGETTTLDEGRPSRGSKTQRGSSTKQKGKERNKEEIGGGGGAPFPVRPKATKYFLTVCSAYW
jgi:hypothetical protein